LPGDASLHGQLGVLNLGYCHRRVLEGLHLMTGDNPISLEMSPVFRG
jgi:hypothetical protein